MGYLHYFYSQEGVYPKELAWNSHSFFTYFHWFDNPYLIAAQFIIAAIIGFVFLLGIHPRIMAMLMWFVYNSLNLRNGYVLHSAEDIMRVMCFWNLFLPFHYKNKKVFSYAGFAAMMQVIVIYIGLMLKRDIHSWWLRADAMSIALDSDPIVSRIGYWLGQFKEFNKWLTRLGYLWEFIIPPLVLLPFKQRIFRLYVPFLMMGFHFGIYLLFDLSTFPVVGMMIWTLFIGEEFWKTRFGKKIEAILPIGDFSKENKILKNIAWKSLRRVMITYGLFYVFLTLVSNNSIKNEIHQFMYMKPFNYMHRYTQIGQNWIMFTPLPSLMSSWHQIIVRREDGSEIDLLTNNPPQLNKPDNIVELYDGFQHWRYIWALTSDIVYHHNIQEVFMKYYCRIYPNSIITINLLTRSRYFQDPNVMVSEVKKYNCSTSEFLTK